MLDIADAYAEVQQRLVGVVLDPKTQADTPVPACPAWRVRDVVAHLAGSVVDVTTGHAPELYEGFNLFDQWRDQDVAQARDAITARQVAERQGRAIDSLVDEWRQATEALVPMLRGEQPFPSPFPPYIGGGLVSDLVVHEGGIRAALGLNRAPECAALSLALAGYGFSLENRIRILGLPALVLAYDGKERRLGEGDVGATVRADRYDLVRTLAGHRTRDQILALDWEGEPGPYLDILSEYGPVTTSTTGEH